MTGLNSLITGTTSVSIPLQIPRHKFQLVIFMPTVLEFLRKHHTQGMKLEMIRPFEYKTSQHIPASPAVMSQMCFGAKFEESPKRVLEHIRQGSTGLVQSEIFAAAGAVKAAPVTDVGPLFFASATCVCR